MVDNQEFYRANRPAAHFRTSAQVGGPMTAAICSLLQEVDTRLGQPEQLHLVDVGAGDGELLNGVLEFLAGDALLDRMRTYGIDIRPTPATLDSRIEWLFASATELPLANVPGLMVCTELLDDIAQEQRVPLAIELCRRMRTGAVLFVDYPADGSGELAAYRQGRQVTPVRDGSVNVTAPVDFEELAAACSRFGTVRRWRQDEALVRYAPGSIGSGIAQIEYRSKLRLLTDRHGLGRHEWLLVELATPA